MADKVLNILEGIEKGLSPSYLGSFNKITGMDIESVPGVIFSELRLRTEYPNDTTTNAAMTFTAATSDLCTASGATLGNWKDGQSVTVSSTTTLPAGLSPNTIYYAVPIGAYTFKLCDSLANLKASSYVDITDAGTGVHTVSPIVMEKPITILKNGSDRFAIDDNNGAIWICSAAYGDTWIKLKGSTAASFNNIALFNNYLIAFASTTIEVFGSLADLDTAAWQIWETEPTPAHGGGKYPTCLMSNGILYVGDDYDVSSLEQIGTFDPTDNGTYTWSQSALDIPHIEVVSALAEYNYALAIGTGRGANYDAKIYFWDTVSPSYDIILNVDNSWVWNLLSFGGYLYFTVGDSTAGTDGTLYVTNGSTISVATKIPFSSTATQQVRTAFPFVINRRSLIEWEGKLLIGVSGNYSAGIYSFNPSSKVLHQKFVVASANEGSATDFIGIYAILPEENNLTVGIMNDLVGGLTYGMQTLNNTTISVPYAVSRTSYLETGLLSVGTFRNKKEYKEIIIYFGKELAANESISLYYRENLSDSYTLIKTVSYADYGAVNYIDIIPADLMFTTVQFKVLITLISGVTTSPEITGIIFL